MRVVVNLPWEIVPHPLHFYPRFTFLVVQLKVAVLVASCDGVRHPVPIWVLGMDDSHECVWPCILRQEGLIAVGWGTGRWSSAGKSPNTPSVPPPNKLSKAFPKMLTDDHAIPAPEIPRKSKKEMLTDPSILCLLVY